MAGLRFLCLGVGDAFSASWYSSCLAVESGGTWLLVDCPHPIRKIVREAAAPLGLQLDVDAIAAVVLTHLHADHASGIEGFAFYSRFALGRRATILGHPKVLQDVWGPHLRASMSRLLVEGGRLISLECDDLFDMVALSDTRAVEFPPFSIECRRTIHPIPTYALKLRGNGRCLAISSDTSYDPGLIEWLSEGDLIIHETNRGLHTPYERLLELPGSIRERMRLIHYPDDFPVDTSAIEALRPGRLYVV